MRGLIDKDFRILLQRKQSLLVFVGIAVLMGVTQSSSFVIPYLTMLSIIWAIGTLSYDDADNGMAFLMTLPYKRSTYVLEKYLFSAGAGLSGAVLGFLVSSATGVAQGKPEGLSDNLILAVCVFPMFLIMVSILIPVQLKYGAEKSRVVLMVSFVVIACLAAAATKVMKVDVDALGTTLERIPDVMLFGIGLIVSILVFLISYRISVSIMERKEF